MEVVAIPLPNKTGGDVQIERKQVTPYNNDGTSKALFANEPNEVGWIHEGEFDVNGDPARQCAASSQEVQCVDCGTMFDLRTTKSCPDCSCEEHVKMRCQGIAVEGYMTCKAHGGGFKQKPEVLAKAHAASQTHGLTIKEIKHCPCQLHGDHCEFKDRYRDENNVPRCALEKQLYDNTFQYFQTSYELDDAADLLMLHRLAMNVVRVTRNEKIIAEYGEITERTRTSGDGTVEVWYEESAASKLVDKIDKRIQAWLKELAITKAAREGRKITVSGTVDLAAVLCGKNTEEVIEL